MELKGHYEWAWTEASGLEALVSALVVCAMGVVATCWLYRHERGVWTKPMRVAVTALRCGVWGSLALLLLGPARMRVEEREFKPPLVVLRDASRSMGIVDRQAAGPAAEATAAIWEGAPDELASQPRTRAATVDRAFQRHTEAAWRALHDRARPRTMDFDFESRSTASRRDDAERPATSWPAMASAGRVTDIGAAVRDALEGEPPVAIVLVTDGRHTGRDDPRDAAREAGERRIPLLVVGVGDSSRPRTVRVAGVYSRPQVWKDEPFEIETLITSIEPGVANFEVSLWRRTLSVTDEEELQRIDSVSLAVPPGHAPLRHRFRQSLAETGRYQYVVKVAPIDGETELEDNQRESAPIAVLERDQLRVLAIAGEATWEYQQVERWLARESTVQSSCWLQSAEAERPATGTKPLERLPESEEELLWYDVLLLLDPDPARLPPDWSDWIRRFVTQHSGGLLYQPGPRFGAAWNATPPGDALRDLWPVEFAAAAEQEVAARIGPALRGWPAQIVAGEQDHPLVQGWPSSPGSSPPASLNVYWTFPAVRARPTARVLLEHGDPATRSADGARPLLVVGRYGAAQIAYLGFPGTWRTDESPHRGATRERFWWQLVRFLGEGRAWQGHRRGWLQADRDRVELGQSVTISARLQDAVGQPLAMSEVAGGIQAPGNQERKLTFLAQPNESGMYEATWTPTAPGLHTFSLAPPADDGPSAPLTVAVSVELPQQEMQSPWLDEPLLRDLARLSGGEYFRLDEVDRLADAVPDRREVAVTRHPPRPVWDGWWTLCFLVALLGGEWWMRKRQRVV